MRLGVIGMGLSVIQLVQTAANYGHTVYIHNHFGNHLLKESLSSTKKIKLVNLSKAASPEIIILFIPMENLETIITRLPDMSTKIIVHVGSPVFNSFFPSFEITQNSATHKISNLLPKSYVIKLYHAILPDSQNASKLPNVKTKFFLSGENSAANYKLKLLLENLNFSVIDLNDWINTM